MEAGDSKHIVAVDVGGTKVAAAVLSAAGKILNRVQEATIQTGPEEGIGQIIRLSRNVIEHSGIEPGTLIGVGIGIPAVLEVDTDHVIWAPNLAGWRNVGLKRAMETEFDLPICLEYDGHAAVLGEWWMGAGRGFRSMVEVIIGTGIGGGMILDDRLIRGRNRLAGAAGWFAMTAAPAQIAQSDRSLGHWESLGAGPGIVQRAIAMLDARPESTMAAHRDSLTAKDVFEADEQGDALAQIIIDDTADLLGLGIANIISLVNPEIVVLGGSIGGNQGERLLPRIRTVVQSWAQPISAESVVLTSSTLGSEAGLLGAARAVLMRVT